MRGLLVALGTVVLCAGLAARAEDASIVLQGKRATALVLVDKAARRSAGSAFCIDASGLYVTNYHVVRDAREHKLTLVINPSEKDERVVEATVVREEATDDVALLQAAGTGPFVPLRLGDDQAVVETAQVTAFGYPFGQTLAANGETNPSITVSTGHVTSLRKSKGELERIQLDASLNPGNSGGPVLDGQGRVVGIVEGGIPGAALNFAIPVDRLTAFLERPDITFEAPPALSPAQQRSTQDFTIRVVRFDKQAGDYSVDLALEDLAPGSAGAWRHHPAQAGEPGTYKVQAVPLPARQGPASLPVRVRFSGGTLTGQIPDREVKLGDQTVKISALASIERGAQTRTMLQDGKRVDAAPANLGPTDVNCGDLSLRVDLDKAQVVEITGPPPAPTAVAYTIAVKRGTKVVGELKGALVLASDVSAAGASTAAVAVAVRPPALAADKVSCKLPAPVDDVVAGGGGRYLLLHLKKLRQLAVFDVNAGKVTKYLPLASDSVLYTAGAQKLLVVLRDQGLLQRWDLRTLEKDLTVPCEGDGGIDVLVLGCASPGPALVVRRSGVSFLDPATLKPVSIDLRTQGMGRNWQGFAQPPLSVRASADGTVFAAWLPHSSPTGMHLMVLQGATATVRYEHNTAGELLPGMDGTVLYTGTGLYSQDLKPLAPEQFRNQVCFPSYHPAYFATIGYSDRLPARSGPGATAPKSRLSVYTVTDRRLLVTLPELDDAQVHDRFAAGEGLLPITKRVHLMPNANLLVTIPEARDELVLRRFDIGEALDKAGIDYLFIASMPERLAQRGATYTYRIDVKSKRGGVRFSLDSGPEGMQVSADGRLTWNVPASLKDSQVAVIVGVKDTSGQEIYHSFTIQVQ